MTHHKLTLAVSLIVDCETQAEVDELWAMQAMLQMGKLDIARLQRAYDAANC